MFDKLTERLGGVFDGLRKRGSLKEADVVEALRELRVALLEADVALPVAKDFIERVQAEAVGEKVLRSVTPGQQVIKIVHDKLVEMLDAPDSELNLNAPAPLPILMVGLQGSGKTTTSAKIGVYLTSKLRKKVLMASLDVMRPAAQEQLEILGKQAGVDTLEIIKGQKPAEIARRAMKQAAGGAYDVVILDTAGRLSIDEMLMDEVRAIRDIVKPVETLLVADAMTGQDAVTTARNFDEKIGITGIVLTRVDGDARGGAALSMRAVTGKPIKLMGVGEQIDALQPFHASRIADRILDRGDIVSLVEKAADTIDRAEAEKAAKKMQKGKFDLDDFAMQLKQMKRMGGMAGIMGMLPGMGKLKNMAGNMNLDDKLFNRQEAIISSMTKGERSDPKVLNASRRKRIAAGSGTSVQDVNQLIKQFLQLQTVMKKMASDGGKGLMRGLSGMMGGGLNPADLQNLPDPSAFGGDMDLGPNPFASASDKIPGFGAGSPKLDLLLNPKKQNGEKH